MKIGIACGGTGGHIFPGLATADELLRQGHEVSLWLAGKDIESTAVGDWKGPIHTVAAEGLAFGVSVRSLRSVYKLVRAVRRCKRIMRKDPPDVLLAMGSYASVGPVVAALRLDVPVVLHEANVVPGRAISLLSRWATAVAGSFDATRFYLKGKDMVLTGMPLRKDLVDRSKAERERRANDTFTLLVAGGSRGAARLNGVVPEALCALHRRGVPFRVIHLAGERDKESVEDTYRVAGVDAEVIGFHSDMGSLYLMADMAICRAGAATCAELSAFGVPALMVPYPYAARDHQTANARALDKLECVDVVAERDLEVGWLTDYVAGCIRDPERLESMRAASRKRIQHQGAEALADLVMRTGLRHQNPAQSAA